MQNFPSRPPRELRAPLPARPLDQLVEIFPNAEPHHGFYGVDIPWNDCDIIVTQMDEDEWLIGLYLVGDWGRGDDPAATVIVDNPTDAIAIVDYITNESMLAYDMVEALEGFDAANDGIGQ